MNQNQLLRSIPKVDDILRLAQENSAAQGVAYSLILESVRKVIAALRKDIMAGNRDTLPAENALAAAAIAAAKAEAAYRLRPLINATGIVLHTNLGRAILPDSVAENVMRAATSYTTLEYNVSGGCRGSRYSHVEDLLCRLTGGEAAMVVNNNAAAVLLILTAICQGREVVVSRGELVEIGGSFRVPEIMEQGGAILKEVGTTNKTRLGDYSAVIHPEITGALLKVHTSNFKVVGFTEEVDLADLSRLSGEHGIPLIYDLGSGALIDLKQLGLGDEPTVPQAVAAGTDVVSFSGDKLLGGPQAGIIIGKQKYIGRIKSHPLTRALRIDKLTLAALEATLRLYLDPEKALRQVPVLAMLSMDLKVLEEKARRLLTMLSERGKGAFHIGMEQTRGQVGGGSVPGQQFPSWAVTVEPLTLSVDALENRLRNWEVPIIGRIYKERYLLDVRTIEKDQFPVIVNAFTSVCDGKGEVCHE